MKPLLQRLPTVFFSPIVFLSAQQKRGSAQCENWAPWEVNTWPLGRKKLCFGKRELEKWHQIGTMKEGKPCTERCTKANWWRRFLTLNINPSKVNVSNWIQCFVFFVMVRTWPPSTAAGFLFKDAQDAKESCYLFLCYDHLGLNTSSFPTLMDSFIPNTHQAPTASELHRQRKAAENIKLDSSCSEHLCFVHIFQLQS